MLGQRSAQKGLFEADTQHLAFVGREGFYGFLASQRGELFRDEDFAGLYSTTLGRPSVPPSLLATALVLQACTGVSDEEARQRAGAQPGGAGQAAGGRAGRHLVCPGTNLPFSICAGT